MTFVTKQTRNHFIWSAEKSGPLVARSVVQSSVKNVNDIRHKPPGPTPAKLSAEIAPHIL